LLSTSSLSPLSLPDALPIFRVALQDLGRVTVRIDADQEHPDLFAHISRQSLQGRLVRSQGERTDVRTVRVSEIDREDLAAEVRQDRKSTRLNSSHVKISYAV